MTAGLIINPLSGKRNNRGLELASRVSRHDHVHVHVLTEFLELRDVLQHFSKHGVRTLFISSGDGTVQAIQTLIAEGDVSFDFIPRFCLLPHGTTNLTASDLGFRVKNLDDQEKVILDSDTRRTTTELKRRPTLRVVNPADSRPRHGMFLGTGAIWKAVVFCQTGVHKTGLKGDWATFATLASAVLKALFVPANPDDHKRIDQPFQMTVRAENKEHASGGELLFLASTLESLILGTRPFWGGKHAAIRASVFPYPPPAILRWLYTSLYGSEDRIMPQGCKSFSADRIDIETECPFVIDGEFFDPPAHEPLRIETGQEFTYVCR